MHNFTSAVHEIKGVERLFGDLLNNIDWQRVSWLVESLPEVNKVPAKNFCCKAYMGSVDTVFQEKIVEFQTVS